MSAGFTYIETPTGKVVRGRGRTIAEAFTEVALGLFALAVDPASVEERETRVVRAHGVEPADLLANWLNECLYVMEVEGFLTRRVELLSMSLEGAAGGGEPVRLHGLLHGEEADPVRHGSIRSLPTLERGCSDVREDDKNYEATVKIST